MTAVAFFDAPRASNRVQKASNALKFAWTGTPGPLGTINFASNAGGFAVFDAPGAAAGTDGSIFIETVTRFDANFTLFDANCALFDANWTLFSGPCTPSNANCTRCSARHTRTIAHITGPDGPA
jgi:hypothetical protein